jgi:hypothetical protein
MLRVKGKPMKNELELIDQVEERLREGKWSYQKQQVIGDARPDFVVTTENGYQIVIEVKAWQLEPENMARATHQVQRYKQLSRAAAALIITATSQTLISGLKGIVPISSFEQALTAIHQRLATRPSSPRKQRTVPSPKRKVFASMPFAAQYDDTFLVGIQPAALAVGAVAERVDYDGVAGNVVAQIRSLIKAAKVVVADLSGSRPNVLHEIGYAEALGKDVIQVCSTPLADLPFNVRNNQTISYSIGQTTKLRKRLESELSKVI